MAVKYLTKSDLLKSNHNKNIIIKSTHSKIGICSVRTYFTLAFLSPNVLKLRIKLELHELLCAFNN